MVKTNNHYVAEKLKGIFSSNDKKKKDKKYEDKGKSLKQKMCEDPHYQGY